MTLTLLRKLEYVFALAIAYQNQALRQLINVELLRRLLVHNIAFFKELSFVSSRYHAGYSILREMLSKG